MKFTSKFATAVAVLVAVGGSASAATLSFFGTGQSQVLANNDLGLGLNGTTIDFISGDLKTVSNGLSVGGPANIKYTYLGYEAGNNNFAENISNTLFAKGSSTVGAVKSTSQLTAGLLDFAFGTTAPVRRISLIMNNGVANPASASYAIGYQKISDTSYYLLFDDIAGSDRDFDDFAMRVDVSAIPLPAAGFLLLGAIGGLGLAARRRKNT